ncbi:MAG: ABC transporter ATP-binding protein [Verrucomicrobiales bacterium]|nr:ABC transporter ATP-binding protein [Verrucomicrobiales bacterium]
MRLDRVTKSYGPRRVLDEVSFALGRGERVALMGPSGAGKSTLLNCIGGIDRPDSGDISVAGQSLSRLDGDGLSRLRRRAVTTVFQFFHLLPTLTAAENVAFPLQLLGVDRADRERRVAELLAAVRVDHRADAWPDELSGGEMQRVAIARALAPGPDLVLADEPTGNLDSATGDAILELLARLGDELGFALLLVTHSRHAAGICSRSLHLRDGRLCEGPFEA